MHTDLWSPYRCTVVYIDTVAIGLTVIEPCESADARYVGGKYVRLTTAASTSRTRHGEWVTTHDFATGRLCLQAYSPHMRVPWTRQWREKTDRDLVNQIGSIVRALENVVPELARGIEEGERQAAIEYRRHQEAMEKWRREEAERVEARKAKASRDELSAIIDDWNADRRIHEFFANVERAVTDLPDERRAAVAERLRRARDLIGETDPLERLLAWLPPDER